MPFRLDGDDCRNLAISTRREWLLTNGLGGYSMGTVSGINTRRYHGLLVAATQPPATRMVLLAGIETTVQVGSDQYELSANQYPGTIFPEGYKYIQGFEVGKSASWLYKVGELELAKIVTMHPGENAVSIRYHNLGNSSLTLELRPLVCHKFYHDNFYESPGYPHDIAFLDGQTEITHNGVSLFLDHPRAFRMPVQGWYYRFEHQLEIERGLAPRDDLYCPCELRYVIRPDGAITFTASTLETKALTSKQTPTEETDLKETLCEAAQRFLVKTKERTSIIAGYPWFTDWGRDTMVALPGVCLHTGNASSAKKILHDYAKQMRQGIIPNRFVEAGEEPQYNTVDATLWFVNSVYRTLEAAWDTDFAFHMMKVFDRIFYWHCRGTYFGIQIDETDGLLHQGEQGVQLTWMDAKIGDWVVTPRHGKPVEVNGLWINALRVMEWLADRLQASGERSFASAAELAESNFDRKFWSPRRGHYLDTADPDDASLRPNQVIAMALPFGPARGEHALQALECVEQELVTPRGLRTLAASEPGYRGRYRGTLPELDAAYHQGTVWPWLLGPYISACVRLRNSAAGLEIWKERFSQMLAEGGLGGIAEVYDGDDPRGPGGCPWQAWSVGEILRVVSEELS